MILYPEKLLNHRVDHLKCVNQNVLNWDCLISVKIIWIYCETNLNRHDFYIRYTKWNKQQY